MTERAISGAASPDTSTRKNAAASWADAYSTKTNTAAIPTANTATRSDAAANTFCPYQGEQIYVKQEITTSDVTNQYGSAGLFHWVTGLTVNCSEGNAVARSATPPCR